jgi:hypothetical protein
MDRLMQTSPLTDQRLFEVYHRVAIDGTRVVRFSERHWATAKMRCMS